MKEKAIQIIKRLQDKGFEAVFAGGCIRDMLMDIEPKDYDIATSALPKQIKNIFPKTIPVGENFGVIIVVEGGEHFEVATFRTDHGSDGRRPNDVSFTSMRNDALRRDLTINGIFFDPISGEMFDYVDGKKDIKGKTIRFIGDPNDRIKEDNLRILRAIRFFSKSYDWFITMDTVSAIKLHKKLLLDVSAERIREELEKMLLLPIPSIAFRSMLNLGVLEVILPELAKLDSISQNPKWHSEGSKIRRKIYGENGRKYILGPIEDFNSKDNLKSKNYVVIEKGNAFTHTMLAIDTARKVSDDPIVIWATLLHDIGKGEPDVDLNGKLVFYDHDEKGEIIADEMLRGLKFSNEDRITITNIVKNHMRVKHLPEMRRAKVRLLMTEDYFDKLLLVSDIDSRSSIHEDYASNLGKRAFVKFAEKFKDSFGDEPIMPKPLINGKDLIDLGLKPSAKFKTILKEIEEAQLDGTITSREEALKYLDDFIKMGK